MCSSYEIYSRNSERVGILGVKLLLLIDGVGPAQGAIFIDFLCYLSNHNDYRLVFFVICCELVAPVHTDDDLCCILPVLQSGQASSPVT
jgi:hypothetical protein